MALFKILRGASTDLSSQDLHDGYAYFTPDDGRFYIDVALDNPPLYMDMVKKSGTVNGETVYRIEVERQAIDEAFDSIQTLTLQHGTSSSSFDGSSDVTIDIQAD